MMADCAEFKSRIVEIMFSNYILYLQQSQRSLTESFNVCYVILFYHLLWHYLLVSTQIYFIN